MGTEKEKSVVSLRGGTLAVYLNIGTDVSEARLIGRNLKPLWQVYIILDNNGKHEYVSIGQADKKSMSFNTKTLSSNNTKTVCGAAVGLYGRREFYEGYLDGYKKTDANIQSPEVLLLDKEKESEVINSNIQENIETEAKKEDTAKSSEKIQTEQIKLENNTFSDVESTDNSVIYKEYKALKDETKAHDTFKKVVDRFKVQMNELEKAGVFTPEEKAEITGEEPETKPEAENIKENMEILQEENTASEIHENTAESAAESEKIKPEENQSQNNDKYGIDYLFSHNEKLNPFKESPYDWIRVCMDEIWLLPIDKHEILNPFVMLSDLKYSHLMLGRSLDKKVIVLAVPEKFRREDIKSAASFGFKDFWRCGEQQGRGVFGYWIKKLI